MIRSLFRLTIAALALYLIPFGVSHGAVLVVNCAVGPFFTINAAVGAAANGDTIVVEDCGVPYNENVVIAGFTDLHVVAASQGDFGARPAGVGGFVNPPVVVTGAGLGGPCFDVQTGEDIKIQNFRITGCTFAAVRIRSAQRALVLANRIISTQSVGIEAINTDDVQISSNVIALTTLEGVTLNDTRVSTVADNVVFRAGRAGVLMIGGDRNRIDNNDIRLTGLEGIVGSGDRPRVERNSFTGTAGPDIFIDAASVLADVVGNSVPGGIVDNGVGSEIVNNF